MLSNADTDFVVDGIFSPDDGLVDDGLGDECFSDDSLIDDGVMAAVVVAPMGTDNFSIKFAASTFTNESNENRGMVSFRFPIAI